MVIINGGNSFYGFLEFGERKYTFDISMPKDSQQYVTLLKVDWRLKRLLGDSLNKFIKENKFKDPMEFYRQFNVFIQNNLIVKNETKMWLKHPLKTSGLLSGLQQEIKSAGSYVTDFDIESGVISIEISDFQDRIHKASLKVSQNYKLQPIVLLSHDLPLQKTGVLGQASYLDNIFSLAEFCEKFSELVAHFQNFWNMIAVVDSQCCILDPVNPTYKDNFRRIKLSDTLSVVVTFNPFCASQMPSIKLLGSQGDVNYYTDTLQKNLENELWDVEEDLMFNLSNVLEVSIPNKMFMEVPEDMDLAESGECAICFTLTLENSNPSEVCENSKCKSVYHSTCLFKYLCSIPRNRDYFGKIQGECPNCEEVIFCTVPKLV